MLLPVTSAPALTHVDSDIFTLRFFGACMACTTCHDGCCQYGCDVNIGERDRILAVKDELAPMVRVPVEAWFDAEVFEDPEYPTGKYVRANAAPVEGPGQYFLGPSACVFLNTKSRGCNLHAFALKTQRDYHQLKPMACWLFPVCWDQKVLQPNTDVTDDLVCAGAGMTLYEAARGELEVVFGKALVVELDAHAATVKQQRT